MRQDIENVEFLDVGSGYVYARAAVAETVNYLRSDDMKRFLALGCLMLGVISIAACTQGGGIYNYVPSAPTPVTTPGPVCAVGTTNCGDVCVSLQSDAANCGACGTICGQGQVCSAAVCKNTCAANLIECGSDCVDPTNNPNHCGATTGCGASGGSAGAVCTNATNAVAACTASACAQTCNAGYADCNNNINTAGSDGCESALDTNQNCGGCGIACLSGQSCQAGSCQQLTFKIETLTPDNCVFTDVQSIIQDDAGGIAFDANYVVTWGDYYYYSSPSRMSAYVNIADLSSPAATGAELAATFTDLDAETMYSFTVGGSIYRGPLVTGDNCDDVITFDGIAKVDPVTGNAVGSVIMLSTPIAMTDHCAYAGNILWSGRGFAMLLVRNAPFTVPGANDDHLYRIQISNGVVTDLSAAAAVAEVRAHAPYAEAWAAQGVVEQFGGETYLTHFPDGDNKVVRVALSTGASTDLVNFATDFPSAYTTGDVPGFALSRSRNRWYSRYEGGNSFPGNPGGGEVVFACDATWSAP